MSRQEVRTDSAPEPAGPYSQGIVAGGLLFISAMGPLVPGTGKLAGTTIEEQTEQVMRNLLGALATRGLDFSDVVKVTAYLGQIDRDRAGFNATYESFLSRPYPARTTVGASIGDPLLVMDATAVLRG